MSSPALQGKLLNFLEDRLTPQDIEDCKNFYAAELSESTIYTNKTRKVTNRLPPVMQQVLDENGFDFIQAIVLRFYTPAWMHIDSISAGYTADDPLAVIIFPLDITGNEYHEFLGKPNPKMLITGQTSSARRGVFLTGPLDPFIVNKVSEDNPINFMMTDYHELNGVDFDTPFPMDVWFDRYRFMPYETFNGITYEAEYEWKPGNVMIVDKSIVHAPSGFNHLGITVKTLVIVNGIHRG